MPGIDSPASPETLRFSVETISGQDLIKQILVDGVPDPRFVPVDMGGVFHYAPLERNSDIGKNGVYYSLLKLNGLIVGIGELQFSPRPDEKDVLWYKSISIDENLKGQGYSDRLQREMFRFTKSQNAKLWISNPTKEGMERTRHKLRQLSQEFGVEIFNSDGQQFTD